MTQGRKHNWIGLAFLGTTFTWNNLDQEQPFLPGNNLKGRLWPATTLPGNDIGFTTGACRAQFSRRYFPGEVYLGGTFWERFSWKYFPGEVLSGSSSQERYFPVVLPRRSFPEVLPGRGFWERFSRRVYFRSQTAPGMFPGIAVTRKEHVVNDVANSQVYTSKRRILIQVLPNAYTKSADAYIHSFPKSPKNPFCP